VGVFFLKHGVYSTYTWAQASSCYRRIRLFSQCIPKTMKAVGFYLLLSSLFLYQPPCSIWLTYSNDFRDKQGVLKLMVGARGPLCTIYRVTRYLRLLALSILTCSPNMSILARLVSDNSRSLDKLEFGAQSSQATSKETVSARGSNSCSWLYLRVRFDLLISINFSDFPKLEAHNSY